ncbi:MAG: TetR/AcrR family transcriptional regulator [Novosphingobium sp.]|nr:TetR/AcrR family transcriptional regulator [Novosphingobium sp.]
MPRTDNRPIRSVNIENADSPTRPDSPEAGSHRRGRPRDPGLEARVHDAAIALYAQGGWKELTFGAVARSAGVGKAALYKRWPRRIDLLRETLEARWYPVSAIDTGSLRGDLVALAGLGFDTLAGPHGGVTWRLRADLHAHPEVRETTRTFVQGLARDTRAIVRRAIGRGELPADTSPALIADLIVGAVSNRVGATPPELLATVLARRDRIIADLVDLVLRGVGADTATGPGPKA